MEGCSKYCSFCVVPYTRGEEVSRPFDDVIAEVAVLAGKGVREVTLLGQNVNGYYVVRIMTAPFVLLQTCCVTSHKFQASTAFATQHRIRWNLTTI